MTISKKLSVRTFWSEEDREYVATCDEYPSLSWLAVSPEKAVEGLSALVRQVKSDRTTQEVLLEHIESLEEGQAQFKAEVNQLIVNLLNQLNKQPSPQKSPDILLHKRLTEIAQENAPDAHKLVIAALANHFKELADGRIHQYLHFIYERLN
jgi:hypothetical protein